MGQVLNFFLRTNWFIIIMSINHQPIICYVDLLLGVSDDTYLASVENNWITLCFRSYWSSSLTMTVKYVDINS